jgi:hypothetical protein
LRSLNYLVTSCTPSRSGSKGASFEAIEDECVLPADGVRKLVRAAVAVLPRRFAFELNAGFAKKAPENLRFHRSLDGPPQ